MNPERSDPSETPKRGIARFLRGEVADRFLGGVAFSAAAMPVTRELNHGRGDVTRELNFGSDQVTVVTREIRTITETMPAYTETIPEHTANFGRFITAQITQVTSLTPDHITPTFTRTPDLMP